jgi:hypothetical protein
MLRIEPRRGRFKVIKSSAFTPRVPPMEFAGKPSASFRTNPLI